MQDWPVTLGVPLWVWVFGLPTLLTIYCYIARDRMTNKLSGVWRFLDRLYLGSGMVAGGFMVLILVIIVLHMIARWTGLTFPGSTEYAAYAMAATSFFAFAYALTHGAHIRVSIFLNRSDFTRFWLDIFALYIGALTITYFARFTLNTYLISFLNMGRTMGRDEVPEGVLSMFKLFVTVPGKWGELFTDAGTWTSTPLWLPKLAMSFGMCLLAIALWDTLIRVLVTGKSNIKSETVE